MTAETYNGNGCSWVKVSHPTHRKDAMDGAPGVRGWLMGRTSNDNSKSEMRGSSLRSE
jgi:hypothetical protein